MALTPSTMLPLGTSAPLFVLNDVVSNKTIKFRELIGLKGTLVMFICNHCPFVKHINEELSRLGRDYQDKGIGLVAISSNDVNNYPEDKPDLLRSQAEEFGFNFPYLYDESQEVARAYDAACTPDFFLFNDKNQLVYRGQLDDSRPGNGIAVTGKDLRTAMDSLLTGTALSQVQKPSIGCNIKWKP